MSEFISPFTFNREKSLEALLYIASSVPNYYRLLKILYFADVIHLERYGRFICGDNYIAMESGPCPSGTYSIIQDKQFNSALGLKIDNDDFIIQDSYLIKPCREPDLRKLSKSDIECIDIAVNKYGRLTGYQLKQISHDEAYNKTEKNKAISILDIAKSLKNSDEIIEHIIRHPRR